LGEVGVAGLIRPVTGLPGGLAVAARLGFRTAYVPTGVLGGGPVPEGMQVVECDDIRRAVGAALQAAPG
jgi:DNA repair protein RadA/Sms